MAWVSLRFFELFYFIILIGGLVFVHELGHFIFAKLFDFKVIRFAIGFGPKIFGFRKGETEYAICAIPLGGYVKLVGENPYEEISEKDISRSFSAKPLWQRTLVVSAGPIFNFILPVIIYFGFFAFEREVIPPIIGIVMPDSPAELAGIKEDDRIIQINSEKIHSWRSVVNFIQDSNIEQALDIMVQRQNKIENIAVHTQSFDTINALGKKVKKARIGITAALFGTRISPIHPQSIASRIGFKNGDTILRVNGQKVSTFHDLKSVLTSTHSKVVFQIEREKSTDTKNLPSKETLSFVFDPTTFIDSSTISLSASLPHLQNYTIKPYGIIPSEMVISKIQPNSAAEKAGLLVGDLIESVDNQPMLLWSAGVQQIADTPHNVHTIKYQRNGSHHFTNIMPQKIQKMDDMKQMQDVYELGLETFESTILPPKEKQDFSFYYSFSSSLKNTYDIIMLTLEGITMLFRGEIPFETVGGPIMIYHLAAQSVDYGILDLIAKMALISVNLGIINLLPIPILDGGHLLFFLIEGIRRRPLDIRVREISQMVGLSLILMLLVFAFKNDIVRFFFR